MRLLTVGLPVHNGMPFLPESIHSLLTQSYEDFELLVVDDGSTDGSLEYLRSVKDRRLRVVSQPNRGLTHTLNRMLTEATTPWLVRQDADDVSYLRRLQLIVDSIEQFPDAGMFYSYARYHHSNGKSLGTFRTTKAPPDGLLAITRSGYLLAICHPTVTLNVQKTLQCGAYRFDLYVEDLDLWWRMSLEHEIRLIPELTVGYRLSDGSVSTKNLECQAINSLYIQYLLLSHLWGLRPLTYEAIRGELAALVDRRKLNSRYNIRLAQIDLAKKDYGRAIKHAMNGLRASPAHLLARVAYEVNSDAVAVNGVDPQEFFKYRSLLWPQEPVLQD